MYKVRRMSEEDYLEHARNFKPKYVDKKLINGKWRYYYKVDANENDSHDSGVYEKTSGNPNSRYGTYKQEYTTNGMNAFGEYETKHINNVTVKKSDKWFSNSKSTNHSGGGVNDNNITYEEGRLERGHRALNKQLKKFKKKTIKSVKSTAKKGELVLKLLFKTSKKKKKKKKKTTFKVW